MAIGLLFAFRGGDHDFAFSNSSILARKRQLGLSSTHFSLFYTHADAAKPSRVECPCKSFSRLVWISSEIAGKLPEK
jgi:hypothetical protein